MQNRLLFQDKGRDVEKMDGPQARPRINIVWQKANLPALLHRHPYNLEYCGAHAKIFFYII